MKTKLERLKSAVEDEACWSGGIDHPWQGSAMVSPWLLERLCELASKAHESDIRIFLQELKEQ